MAASAIYAAMNGDKALFPLFTKTQGAHGPNAPATVNEAEIRRSGLDGACDEPQKQAKADGARKPRKKQIPGQKTLQEIVHPRAESNGTDGDGENLGERAEIQQNGSSPRRSKRRRTSRTDSIEVGGQDEENRTTPQGQRHASPQVIIPRSSPLPSEVNSVREDAKPGTPPKKMLRLKAGGKFSSPVSKKTKDDEHLVDTVKKRRPPRKSKEIERPQHLTAVMKYDTQTEVGIRIDRILNGEERFKKQVKIVPKKQSVPQKSALKSAHPFFDLDKRKEQARPPPQPSPRKASAVTPGKLRREALSVDNAHPVNEAQETWTSTLLKDRLMFKHPGAKESAWPDREQAHVRGFDSSPVKAKSTHESRPTPPRRKGKAIQRSVLQEESVLAQFASGLEAEKDGQLRADGFREPHPSLRLPRRSLISGQEMAASVAGQVSARLSQSDIDELSVLDSSQQQPHRVLQSVHERVLKSLNAFDEGRGETTSWSHKYAPSGCNEVLQPPRQTRVLKEWLSSLKVSAVDTALRPDVKAASRSDAKIKKRKRRRKEDDLDDFLVDDDEPMHDMDELTDPEDTLAPAKGRKALNSIVQVAAEGVKLSNAVLLSGPHGCGKSAAAYAVAKELGFKVFEINSSERRSGKDVLDKVGDMTENHLVKHHGTESGEQSSTEEPNVRLDEAFQRDLACGRQGKMASFFKPQTKPKPKPKTTTTKETTKTKAANAIQNVLKKPPKDQRQSLILLEEVDVLFREDKDFWSSVLKLIATSKRPFIMTCNDEDLVPLQAMSLHAVLRFTPPPADLATDYLLLIAAAEGHLLSREAVMSLYQAKSHDIRASIAELSLWCQMGVGDPRGGLSWIYQRYPPGSDLDVHGRPVRVASSSTYQKGMGVTAGQGGDQEGKLAWAWQQHDIDPSTALGWGTPNNIDCNLSLKNYARFADSMSAADIYARALCFPTLDITQKPVEEKSRSHYIEGLPLLQTDEEADFAGLSSEILTTSTLLAFETHGLLSRNGIQAKLDDIDYTQHINQDPSSLTRDDFAVFDPISLPTDAALSTTPGLQQSAFDGPLVPIAIDIAPYVRSIVHFDLALAEQRDALSDGTGGTRARTTRAARSALEGGQRETTRREKWFTKSLDLEGVLRTGGVGWPRVLAVGGAGSDGEAGSGEDAPASSGESS